MNTKKVASAALIKATGSIVGLLIVLAILIAVNVITSSMRLRADLTEEKLYTLSEGSKSILGSLDEKVELKFFFNRSYPDLPRSLRNYALQVEDLLNEYKIAGNGNLVVTICDPKADSDEEEWARNYGLAGQQAGMMGPTLYFGLVAVSGDSEDVIPVIDPNAEGVLEYNITRLIYRVVNPSKPVIGVMSSLAALGVSAPPMMMPGRRMPETKPAWVSFQQLRKDYDVREVAPTATIIDSSLSALVVVHPKGLSDKTIYAIDQYVLKGGRLLLFVDPFSLADMELTGPSDQPYAEPSVASDLKRLLRAWGVGYNVNNVLADLDASITIPGRDGSSEDSPLYMLLDSGNMSEDDTLTTQLETMMVPYSGMLEDNTSPDVTMTPLIMSSDNAGSVSAQSAAMTFRIGMGAIKGSYIKAPTPRNIAVRITGKLKTAFPDGPPMDAKEETEGDETEQPPEPEVLPGVRESVTESTVLVVADVDCIFDRYCVREMNFMGYKSYQPVNDNLNFFINAVEKMSGSSDLISIRTRGKFNRPFDKVLELEREARSEWQDKEKVLMEQLATTQRRMQELQREKDQDQRYILSKEQQDAIDSFQEQEKITRKQLKEVRKSLRKEIDKLGIKLRLINILLMPAVVALLGICFGIYRRKR